MYIAYKIEYAYSIHEKNLSPWVTSTVYVLSKRTGESRTRIDIFTSIYIKIYLSAYDAYRETITYTFIIHDIVPSISKRLSF